MTKRVAKRKWRSPDLSYWYYWILLVGINPWINELPVVGHWVMICHDLHAHASRIGQTWRVGSSLNLPGILSTSPTELFKPGWSNLVGLDSSLYTKYNKLIRTFTQPCTGMIKFWSWSESWLHSGVWMCQPSPPRDSKQVSPLTLWS